MTFRQALVLGLVLAVLLPLAFYVGAWDAAALRGSP